MKKLFLFVFLCSFTARAADTVITFIIHNEGTTSISNKEIRDFNSPGTSGTLYGGGQFGGVPGTTDTFTWTRSGTGTRYINVRFNSSASGNVWQSFEYDGDETAQTIEFNTWGGLAEDPGSEPDVFVYDRCVQNTGETPVFYSYTDSTGAQWESPPMYPGDAFCATFSNTTGPHTVTWSARPAIPDGNGGWLDTAAYSYTPHNESGSGDGWGTEAEPPFAPFVSDPGPGVGNGTPEGNIDWTTPTGTDLAKDRTLQDVGDILHNDLQSGLSNIGAQTAGTRLGVDGLAGKLDTINGTLLAGNGASQLTELQSINAGQAAANAFLASIDASNSNIALSASTSATQLNNIYNAVAAGDPLSDDILAKLGEIGLATQAGSDGITTSLVPDLTAIRAAIDVLKSQGTTENNWLQQIEDHTEDIDAFTSSAAGSLNEIEADAETIKDELDTIKDYTIASRGELDDIERDTSDIDTNTDDIEPKLDAIKDSIDEQPDYTTILGEIELNTDATATSTHSIDTTFDEIRDMLLGTDNPTTTELEQYLADRENEAEDAAATGVASLESWSSKAPTYSGPSDFILAESDVFVIQAVGLAGETYDISVNPLDYPAIATIADWIKSIIAWLITVIVPYLAYQKAWTYLGPALTATQAVAAGQAVAGTNYNFIASKAAAAGIVAVVTGIIVFVSTWMSGHGFALSAAVSSPPVTGSGTAVAIALHLVDCFIPLATVITGTLTLVALHYALGPVTFAAWAVVKFLNI